MDKKIIKILKNVGAILTDDHFVYTSGKHGSVYINKDFLYPHTKETSHIGRMFAEKYRCCSCSGCRRNNLIDLDSLSSFKVKEEVYIECLYRKRQGNYSISCR